VLATHEWEFARAVADDAVVLVGGRVAHRAAAGALQRSDLAALYAGAPRS
jgi:hypothetical protein